MKMPTESMYTGTVSSTASGIPVPGTSTPVIARKITLDNREGCAPKRLRLDSNSGSTASPHAYNYVYLYYNYENINHRLLLDIHQQKTTK